MINELIILLSDKQQKELIKRAEKAGYDDDLQYLQLRLNEWLNSDVSFNSNNNIAKALAKGISEAKRLTHTEK